VSDKYGRRAAMLDYLQEHARAHPQREAAVEGALRLSYAELAQQVERVAQLLSDKGMGAGQVLAYIGPPGIQYYVSLLAAFRCGATWVGLNPKYRSEELAYVIGHARPAMVLVASTADARSRNELALALDKSGAKLSLVKAQDGPSGLAEAIAQAQAVQHGQAPQDDIVALGAAVLVYTSGSTGRPKGACLSASNLVENAWWLARRLGFAAGRFLINLPVNHAGCISDTTLVALLNGDCLVFMAEFDALQAGQLVRDEAITVLGQVPTQYQMMHAAGVLTPAFLGSVRHLGWGGSAMPESLIAHLAGFIPDLFNSYGLTESSGTISVTAPGASIAQLAGTVGLPVFEGAVRIVDAQDQPVAPGESGELQLHGRHVFPGYLRNSQATRLAFTPDGWLRTGDTGTWCEDGSLRLAGRLTEMYKSGGYNIYPREIEVVLESHPGVAMAAVIGVADPLWGEVGHAFVVPSAEGVSAEALVALCRERLAPYKLPKKIDLRSELPLLPIGKVDKKQLRNLVA
jgi:long-chain acyl-CoA synthetase